MTESLEKMRRSGMISHKAFNALQAKTKVQRSKMAEFDSRKRDEGQNRDRGEVPPNELNHKTNQRKGPRMSAGERDGKAPTRNAIDTHTGKKFPLGGKVAGKDTSIGRKGGVIQSGPEYGGPSSRKYG
jgi:hypothetical protein